MSWLIVKMNIVTGVFLNNFLMIKGELEDTSVVVVLMKEDIRREQEDETLHINLDSLPESQAGNVRHKSPHAAYAQGYLDGISSSYWNK